MVLTEETRRTVEQYRRIGCHSETCRAQAGQLVDILLEALAREEVTGFEPLEDWLLNGIHRRPAYALIRRDGAELKIAFTGMTMLMVFSSRNRYTHCGPGGLTRRLERFLGRETGEERCRKR